VSDFLKMITATPFAQHRGPPAAKLPWMNAHHKRRKLKNRIAPPRDFL